MKSPIVEEALVEQDANLLSEVTSDTLLEKQPSELKNVLLQTLSHELRTPFSVIQSSAELLVMSQRHSASTDRNTVLEHAQTILHEISHVTDVINRMVLFSRWENGEARKIADPADIVTATRECLTGSFSPWRDDRTIVLKIAGRPRLVRTDPVLFQLILRNLVENAFKYSIGKEPPVVELRFSAAVWSVSVKDFGIGIPEEDLGRLFQAFERGSNVGNTPGMGLGLRIAHYLVNNFYGTLAVKSKTGKGTTAIASFLYR